MANEFDASDEKQVQDRKSKLGRQAAADQQVVSNLVSTEPARSWQYSHAS
jgi:hypothetical protein